MPDRPSVAQVMTRDPVTVSPADSIRVAIDRMRARNCRRLPVVENGLLVGIISDRDLRRAANSPLVLRERWQDDFMLDHIPVRAAMTPGPVTVSPQTPMVEAARLMSQRKLGGLPVVEGEALVGIVTETDLLNYLVRILDAK